MAPRMPARSKWRTFNPSGSDELQLAACDLGDIFMGARPRWIVRIFITRTEGKRFGLESLPAEICDRSNMVPATGNDPPLGHVR